MKTRKMATIIAVLIALAMVLAACNGGGPAAPAATPAAPAAPADPAAPGADAPEEPQQVEFPTRNITIYGASAVGSPTDVMARELARSIEDLTGVSVDVVDATGGGGGVMMGSVFAQPADGYTWGALTAMHIIALHGGLYRDFPIENFQWVSRIQDDAIVLSVRYDSPFYTLEDLANFARENPGELLVAGQGTGSGHHLSTLQVGYEMDFEFTWLPTDGGPENLAMILGGHVDAVKTAPVTVRPYHEVGTIRVLATSGDTRTFADAPTFEELGVAMPFSQYRGIFVRNGTDMEIVQAISNLIREATLTETFLAYMESVYMDDAFMDYVQFTEVVRSEFETLDFIVRELLGS